MDNKKINEIVAAIRKKYADKTKYPLEHDIQQHVFLHFALMDCLNEVQHDYDADTKVEKLKQELEHTISALKASNFQLNNIHDYLCSLTSAKLPFEARQLTTIEGECLYKIDSLVPNGDKLGELIDKIQSRVPNMPALNCSQCHHLGKMLSAAIKEDGKK